MASPASAGRNDPEAAPRIRRGRRDKEAGAEDAGLTPVIGGRTASDSTPAAADFAADRRAASYNRAVPCAGDGLCELASARGMDRRAPACDNPRVARIQWFDDFVNGTVAAWGRLSRLAQANPTTTAVGRKGERYIATLLSAAEYWAALSPGSRSPADVWGAHWLDDELLHLPTIQVKSSSSAPRELLEGERQELGEFAQFVEQRFRARRGSAVAIVSAWDAGVQTRPGNRLVRWQLVGHVTPPEITAARARRVMRNFQATFGA